MLTAKCLKIVNHCGVHNVGLERGKEYQVKNVIPKPDMCEVELVGVEGKVCSNQLQFFSGGQPCNIYNDKRYNKFVDVTPESADDHCKIICK